MTDADTEELRAALALKDRVLARLSALNEALKNMGAAEHDAPDGKAPSAFYDACDESFAALRYAIVERALAFNELQRLGGALNRAFMAYGEALLALNDAEEESEDGQAPVEIYDAHANAFSAVCAASNAWGQFAGE